MNLQQYVKDEIGNNSLYSWHDAANDKANMRKDEKLPIKSKTASTPRIPAGMLYDVRDVVHS